jgi:hypothetical protein
MGCFCFRPSHDGNNDIELEKGCRLLLLGLDDAGKTSNSKHYADNLAIIYTLKLGTAVDTIPTVGFNIENIVGIKDTHLTVVVLYILRVTNSSRTWEASRKYGACGLIILMVQME